MTQLLSSKTAILYGAAEAGGIGVSFNLVSRGDVQGRPIAAPRR